MPITKQIMKQNDAKVIELLTKFGPLDSSSGITSFALLDSDGSVLRSGEGRNSRPLVDGKVNDNKTAEEVTGIIRRELIQYMLPHVVNLNTTLSKLPAVGGVERLQFVLDKWALTLVPVFHKGTLELVLAGASEGAKYSPGIVRETVYNLLDALENIG